MFFNANGASVYRASLARQQGIVVAGCKSSSLEIRRISLLKATRSALKIEMIFEGDKKCCKKVSNPLQILVKWAFIFLLKLYICLEGVYEKNKMPLLWLFLP